MEFGLKNVHTGKLMVSTYGRTCFSDVEIVYRRVFSFADKADVHYACRHIVGVVVVPTKPGAARRSEHTIAGRLAFF